MKHCHCALVALTTLLSGCATVASVQDTDKAMTRVTALVEQKKLGEALNELKSIAHCEKPALIGSNCGAWILNYELEGAPVQFRTSDEKINGRPEGNAGTDTLKQTIRFMSALIECGKPANAASMGQCLGNRAFDRAYYTNLDKKLAAFKDFACGRVANINPRGPYSGPEYQPSEVFVLKSDFGKRWSPVQSIESSEMCRMYLKSQSSGG